MTDRPILFSAPMVRALLDGRKTQTRRILKEQPELFPIDDAGTPCGVGLLHVQGDPLPRITLGDGRSGVVTMQQVRFAVGDRLWVKETHTCVGDADRWTLYRASGYEAECHRHGFDKPYPPESDVRWKPSIFMPRSRSRLTLIVTDLRVQRLQDITLGEICAEGLGTSIYDFKPIQRGFDAWIALWDSINGAGAWEANPWVVAVSFDVIKGNIDG